MSSAAKMFTFMKKEKGEKTEKEREEKERRKREKRDKKRQRHEEHQSRLSSEELHRLDEMRQSLKKSMSLLKKDSKPLPSGITADYRDTVDASNVENVATQHSDASSTSSWAGGASGGSATSSLSRPASLPPPRPPSRGILKGQNYNHVTRSVSSELDDSSVLLKNTQANELLLYENIAAMNEMKAKSPTGQTTASSVTSHPTSPSASSMTSSRISPGFDTADREINYENVPATTRVRAHHDHVSPVTPAKLVSPAAVATAHVKQVSSGDFKSLLTGENIGLRQRPLSTDFSLQLPGLVAEVAEAEAGSAARPAPAGGAREVALTRRGDSGDFGIVLRRGQVIKTGGGRQSPKRDVILVEARSSSPLLLPGDQLLEVNSECVVNKSREEVNEVIKNAEGEVLSIKVQPIPELFEMSQRVLAARLRKAEGKSGQDQTDFSQQRFKIKKAKSEEQLATEKAFLEAERVWLVHKEGFAAAGLLQTDENTKKKAESSEDGEKEEDEGKVRVQLDYNGEIIEVDEDDVEKANPPNLDKVEDLSQLRYLNESSVLHTLRQRFGNSLIHTYAGPTIIAVNPMAPLAIYSDKVAHMFKECRVEEMPPHIFSVSASAHRTLLTSRKDQSIVFVGRSGSGKTTNVRHVLNYFAATGANVNSAKIWNADKSAAVNTLLEAFGNTRTVINANATRFSSLYNLDFDSTGQIASVSLQTMLLEKTRVVRRPDGEPNFNVFYQLLAGLDAKTRKELYLDNLNEPNLFMTPLSRTEDKTKAAAAWSRICTSGQILGVSPSEALALWSVLAAIYHLGVASVSRGPMGKTQFAEAQAAQRAAHCLGTNVEDLTRAVFQGNTSSTTLNRRLRSAERDSANLPDGIESLEAFVTGLYQEVFNAVVFLINRSTSTNTNAHNSLLLVDIPGFQNPSTCVRAAGSSPARTPSASSGAPGAGGATFEDLCHNYAQERLQLLFHDRTIGSLYEKYVQEQVDCGDGLADADDLSTPAPLVALIDKQAGVRASQTDLASADKRGLLWLLDEEALFPGATDESFVARLLGQYGGAKDDLLKKGPTERQFVLQHFQGTNPVLYNASGWLQASREDGAVRAAAVQLQESSIKPLSELFCSSRGPMAKSVSGSIAGLEGNHSLRRASSIRRAFTSGGQAGIKRHSLALQVKFQVDSLMEQLRRTRVHFVHCFLPQHHAGLCDVKAAAAAAATAQGGKSQRAGDEIMMNVPLVRSQLRGTQILDVVRLHKTGFPESLSYGEFWRRYRHLSDGPDQQQQQNRQAQPGLGEIKAAVEDLLGHLDLDKSAIRLGNTQIFLRSGVLSHLDEERDAKLSDQVVRLQAICRGHLARKRIQRLKTQDIAIRCIQKNVRKFMGVREWPWWRLLVKLTPLLNVHRTEDELKTKTEELEALRARLEKVEKERSEFKQANDRMESRLTEMAADLAEEHSTATLATERLEAEQADRLKLEKEKAGLMDRNKQLMSTNERMEMEVLYSRTLEMNGGHGGLGGGHGDDSDEDGDGGSSSIFKQKYERAIRELEYTKKRLQQQHEDDMEQLMALKKQLEKKLNDAYEEVDEQRQVVAQWKRKTHKAQGEMHDVKLLLEEQTSRNALLEKKQRRFDAEIGSLQEERRLEQANRDKLHRELDEMKRNKYQLDDELQAMKLDLEYKDEKISSLSKELEDLSHGGGHGAATDEEFSAVKRQKNDLEMRLKDQEEELDDLAGQVQLLEQAKTKLEMSMAALKKDHRRELSSKEDELEDARTAAQKKVKALEQQLESEHEERIHFVREKHDLETKILNLQDLASRSADEEQVAKLKKDLKRTKALLKDAQVMMERSRAETSNKVVLRQLKNQLEDAEFGRTAALKSKQNAEMELSDVQAQLDDVLRGKADVEDKLYRLSREKTDLSSQLEDNEEELQDVMKKFKASVSQLSVDQITIQEQANTVSDLEEERNRLREQLAEFAQKISSMEGENVSTAQHYRLELKIKELESKLELEQTTRGRMETQINRLKEAVEKLNLECDAARTKEQSAQELVRKLQRQLRDLKENYAGLQQKETEVNSKKNELEKQLELAEAETITAKNDLKLALKRIEDLQTAINGELDSDSDAFNSDNDSDDDDLSENDMDSFMEHHRRATSIHKEIRGGSMSRHLETMSEEPELKL